MTKTDLVWDEIYQRYMTSRLTYRQLADQYGVSFSVLCRKGAREHWPQQRRQALRDCASRDRSFCGVSAEHENSIHSSSRPQRSGLFSNSGKGMPDLKDAKDVPVAHTQKVVQRKKTVKGRRTRIGKEPFCLYLLRGQHRVWTAGRSAGLCVSEKANGL